MLVAWVMHPQRQEEGEWERGLSVEVAVLVVWVRSQQCRVQKEQQQEGAWEKGLSVVMAEDSQCHPLLVQRVHVEVAGVVHQQCLQLSLHRVMDL